MSRYLMTHSLLSSWLYSMRDNPYEDMTTERDSYAEFLTTLRREKTPPTDAMKDGIAFEDLVLAITHGEGDTEDPWYRAAREAASYVVDGAAQFKAHKELVLNDGTRILLYGRIDWLKAGVIYDTKFSRSYDVGKYVDSTQHPVYFELVPDAYEFTYLVSNGSTLWPETYRRDETPDIRPTIENFIDFLKIQGLYDLYREKWVTLE